MLILVRLLQKLQQTWLLEESTRSRQGLPESNVEYVIEGEPLKNILQIWVVSVLSAEERMETRRFKQLCVDNILNKITQSLGVELVAGPAGYFSLGKLRRVGVELVAGYRFL